jgi:chromosome partitioning protein
MPVVLAIANQKGGSGKTTVCLNLGSAIAEQGRKVLVVDADPQASALNWRDNAESNQLGVTVVLMPSPNLHKEIPTLGEPYDVVLIDCPPGGFSKADTVTRSAILSAHYVLMPVRPSPVDYQASAHILPLLTEIAAYHPALELWIVTNGNPGGNTRLGRDAHGSATEFFQADGLTVRVLKTEIGQRLVFAESAGSGESVLTFQKNGKAAGEIRALAKEILTWLRRKKDH